MLPETGLSYYRLYESRRPCWRTAAAGRVRLVAKKRCGVLQARAEPGVAFLNGEGLPPLSSNFRGRCCLQIMDSIVRHVRRSVRCRDPPSSLVRAELLL